MTVLITSVHIIACLLLIVMILVQAGRGGGLVSGFSGIESMFGTKTNTFLTKTTTVLSVVFFITCLGLAVLSAKKSKSIMHKAPITKSNPLAAATQANSPIAASVPAPAGQQAAPVTPPAPIQNTADATTASK